MDGYGILVYMDNRGSSRYRTNGTDVWDLDEAEALAFELVNRGGSEVYVTFGNGDHEFRMWAEGVNSFPSFDHGCGDVPRWAEYYIDVEINDHRWQFHPIASLNGYDDMDELVTEATALASDGITRLWIGASDGSEEFDTELTS